MCIVFVLLCSIGKGLQMSKQVVLVLGFGGVCGYVYIGVIEEFEVCGYEIICIVGCFMGLVIGGIYVVGKLCEYCEWVESLDYFDVLCLFDVSFCFGVICGEWVFGKIYEIFGEVNIEDLLIFYMVVVIDFINQQEIWFQEGCLYQVMCVLVVIFSLFILVMQGSCMLVDGGLFNLLLIVLVVLVYSDLIIVVNFNVINQKQYYLLVIECLVVFKGCFDSMIESFGYKFLFFCCYGDDNILLELSVDVLFYLVLVEFEEFVEL